MPTAVPEVLWRPEPTTARASSLAKFARFARERRGVSVAELDYSSLHAWSVRDPDAFWSAAAEFLGVRFHTPPTGTLASARMPGAEWFPGSTLNYAEHALTDGLGRGDDDLALVFVREDGLERLLTYGELRELVGRVRAGLLRLGIGARRPGSRAIAQLRRGAGGFPRCRQPRGDVVVVLTGLRDTCRARSVRPAGTSGIPRSRRLPLRG